MIRKLTYGAACVIVLVGCLLIAALLGLPVHGF